jgi:hypothetical protein
MDRAEVVENVFPSQRISNDRVLELSLRGAPGAELTSGPITSLQDFHLGKEGRCGDN